MVKLIPNGPSHDIIDIHLEFLSEQMDFIKWVKNTHPSTYNRLKKAHRGAMNND